MGARAAEVESGDGRPVSGTAENRSHGKELIERRLAVQDVTAGESIRRFEIARRDHLLMNDETLDARRVPRQGADDVLPQVVGCIGPRPPARERVWRELHVDRHHVRTGRSERRVVQRRERDVEIWIGGHLTVLRRVERALEVVDARSDLHASSEIRWVAHARECRQRAERQVDLRAGSRAAIVSHADEKARDRARWGRPCRGGCASDRRSR